MIFLESFVDYNPKNYLSSKEYVDSNLNQLIRLFPTDCDLSVSEMYEVLISLFSKYPDLIRSYSIYTVGRPNTKVVPNLMNIGGVVKYR